MDERPPHKEPSVQTTPFDDFAQGRGMAKGPGWMNGVRRVSWAAMAFALGSILIIIAMDVMRWGRVAAAWRIKSALPLIGIGVSNALLQTTLRRKWVELCLSLAVSAAFVLWGVEQYLPGRIASRIDDVVVFLFVLDLAVVIRGRLKEGA